VQTTPADIRDDALLRLLGGILRLDVNGTAGSSIRLQLLRPGFPWQALVELAWQQGVLLPLIFALTTRALSPPIPRSIKRDDHVSVRLKKVYALHLAHRKRQQQQLQEILLALARAGVVPLILKGARYLVDPVGKWSEARAMGDFDILIQRGDTESTQAALIAAGYRQVRGQAVYVSAHHLVPLEHSDHPMTLEIHVDALTSAAAKFMSTARIWSYATTTDASGFLVLPPIWQAVHCLLHHQVQDRGHPLRKLCIKGLWEWSMLAHGFNGHEWSVIRNHMRAAGAVHILDSWSVQSHQLFGVDVPWLPEISMDARRHADATLRGALRPYWMRRAGEIADELKISFARETLAVKYEVAPGRVSLAHVGRNLLHLLQRHRGNALRRLTGHGRQP
jgi:hypothetical protein